jgi:putative hemolysin
LFGELLPKRIGLNHPEAIAKAVALFHENCFDVTAPFILVVNAFYRFLAECFTNKTTLTEK